MQMYLRLETKCPQQFSMKKSLAFHLEMPGIHLLWSELPLLRARAEAHWQHETRWDFWLPFMTRQSSNRNAPRVSSSSPSCDGSRNKAASWMVFPLVMVTVLSTSKLELARASVEPGSEWEGLRSTLSGWPVSFPLCPHHKASRDHTCPFCGHLCVNFQSIVSSPLNLAFC